MRSLGLALICLFLTSVLLAQETRPAVKIGEGRAPKTDAEKNAAEKGTHKHTTSIDVLGGDGKTRMQTLAVDEKGRILALVAQARTFSGTLKAISEVQVYSGDGKKLNTIEVKFHAQSLNGGPDDSIFVAGDGKVARFDKDGKLLGELELPHIKKAFEDKAGMTKQAEEQIAQMKKSFAESYKQFEEQKKKLEDIAEEKRTALQKRQLQQYEAILKSRDASAKYYDSLTVESVLKQQTSRMRVINSVAVGAKDIFIVCGESKGYGYAVWRMGHDFKDAKQIISGLSGCCGQMDVQVSGDKVLVAENTKHQFGVYDREGKKLSSHGKRGTDKDTDTECFGSCCNPMNLRAGKDGDIYTAESEGIIKRFNAKGDFVELIGYAPLTGGCKNVAVGVSPDASRVYFADQPGSRVIVLTKK